MPSFAELLQQGAGQAWLFIPSAIILGALHGLEPGHSKTMMAAFIVAIRGTVGQAVMLGVAATISHTAIVWGIALAGMHLWQGVEAEAFEPWFQLLSGIIIIGMALWMLRQTRRDQQAARAAAGHRHDDHAHGRPDNHVHAEVRRIDTGHGSIALEILEDGAPPRWRIGNERGAHWRAEDVALATERPDGTVQNFAFVQKQGYLEPVDAIPKPHEFIARLSLGHVGHSHDYDLAFMEGHGHDHMHEELQGLALATEGYQDPHELAHANDIRRRFAGTRVSNWQIIVFGLTGGLIPCPAAITVLLLCLQLDEFALGATLVLCFSIGLAITLVAVGAVAAIGVRTVSSRSRWFSTLAARAPYFSGALLIVVGLYVSWHGLSTLLA